MTDQMEPVDDATKYRRKIDDSLARFGAAHDELEAEERSRRERKDKLVARLEQTRTKLHRAVTVATTAVSSKVNAEGHAVSDDQRDGDQRDGDEKTDETDDDAKAAPQTRLQEKKERRNQRAMLAGRITAIAVAVLVFIATGIAWGAKTWFNSQFNEIAALDENSKDIRNAAGQIGDANFLIVGSDTREGAELEDHVGDSGGIPGARSDTVMIAHVPKDRQRAVVVSFPRDLEISRPDCERWNPETGEYAEVVPGADTVKLNSAFTVGGPRCVTKVIQQISGMKINHFVGIDFQGFKGMVDAVGGVVMNIEEPMRDQELGLIVAETGEVRLRGEQALNFVRARKVFGDPTFSDYGRMQRQQEFMASLLKATLSKDVLLDVGKLTGFVTAFAESTFGENIGIDQLLTLAQSMQGLSAGAVQFMTVPTVGEANDNGNEELLEADTKALFHALIENTPLPGDEEEAPQQAGGAGDDQQAAPA
ncbi:transcriptional regulator [Prauserella marina]|uniref:Cell envelope-related function transcriptional attenuator common domain-containing protein n=1 Tax=Prauserella marina TaxID=530584 RepID=A0A222W0U6_9PSEU|nr:LCP family protein [Prauserella marina]ASR39817.1 transcriptional regulator [Prauserella marina]PWV81907.1 LytR family transcriptional attenuator [Prauserella marina]SDD15071.1 cell envelope-related function transcriptional attenuator common domain-containing protein [Prauserella marina]